MIDLVSRDSMSTDEWLTMSDVRQSLLKSIHGLVPIHYQAGTPSNSLVVASVLLPRKSFRKSLIDDLVNWNTMPYQSGWGEVITFGVGGKKNYSLEAPFADFEPASLSSKVVPIYTLRENPLVKDREAYMEINPQITHIHDLHWVNERSAYCTLDEAGDIQEVIPIKMGGDGWLVAILEDLLLRHMLLGNYILIRFFDCDRSVINDVVVPNATDQAATERIDEGEIYARWTPVRRGGRTVRAYMRGFQIVRPPKDARLRQAILDRGRKQYSTFITHDWKHQIVAEVSCDPENLGNYFVDSPYPYEISPAFFKREVLRKYQDDPDKYTVEEGSISCRSSWSLRFAVNEAGQVHAYLKDLGHLPYSEQLYWCSYNEKPKGSLSEGTYRRDFLGQWYDEPEPLRDLKRLLRSFPAVNTTAGSVELWRVPEHADTDLADRVHYLAGTSSKEWENEIVALDRFVVEGLNLKYLRRVAEELGIAHETLGSIVLLREVLTAKGIADDIVKTIFEPLKELHDLRSKFGSHRKSSDTTAIAKEIRRRHKDLAAHHRDLVRRTSEAMTSLSNLIRKNYLNLVK
jgi:hypothetical protein